MQILLSYMRTLRLLFYNNLNYFFYFFILINNSYLKIILQIQLKISEKITFPHKSPKGSKKQIQRKPSLETFFKKKLKNK